MYAKPYVYRMRFIQLYFGLDLVHNRRKLRENLVCYVLKTLRKHGILGVIYFHLSEAARVVRGVLFSQLELIFYANKNLYCGNVPFIPHIHSTKIAVDVESNSEN